MPVCEPPIDMRGVQVPKPVYRVSGWLGDPSVNEGVEILLVMFAVAAVTLVVAVRALAPTVPLNDGAATVSIVKAAGGVSLTVRLPLGPAVIVTSVAPLNVPFTFKLN